MRSVVVVGDLFLDVDVDGRSDRFVPDTVAPVLGEERRVERAGGAGLAATLLAGAHPDADVTLVTALPEDADADVLRALLPAGVRLVTLPADGTTPAKIRLRSGGTTVARLDRGGPHTAPRRMTDDARAALAGADAVLVSATGAASPPTRTSPRCCARWRPACLWSGTRIHGAPTPRRRRRWSPPTGPRPRAPWGGRTRRRPWTRSSTPTRSSRDGVRGRSPSPSAARVRCSSTGTGRRRSCPPPASASPTRAVPATGSRPRPSPCSPRAGCPARLWPPRWPPPARSSPRAGSVPLSRPPPSLRASPPTRCRSSRRPAPAARPWWPPVAASTSCTRATSPPSRAPAGSVTSSSSA